MGESGWLRLFGTAFKRSRNSMVLSDPTRSIVDANPAFLALVGQRRDAVLGRKVYSFVADGPLVSDVDWLAALSAGEVTGEADMLAARATTVRVQWAASAERISGRRLVLFVALSTSRWGERFRRRAEEDRPPRPLTPREREIVHLVSLGLASPEIAQELHISGETVRTHIRNAMAKVGARSRAHLVAKSLGDGLLLRQ